MKALERLIGNSTLANVATLVFGAALAQAITLGVSPILTRFFEPEDFGALAVFTSMAGIIGVVATARLEIAIVLPRYEHEARMLFRMALRFAMVVSAFTGMVLTAFYLAEAPFALRMGIWAIGLLPLFIFCSAVTQIFYYYFLRKKDFFGNSLGRVILAAGTAVINISFGLMATGHMGLITGTVVGAALAMAYYFFRGKDSLAKDLEAEGEEKVSGRKVVSRYRDFILINTPHVLMETFFELGLVFVLNYYFNDKLVGWYAFAFRILKAPVSMVGSALNQVLYKNMVEKRERNESLKPVVQRTLRQLFLLALPIFTLLFFFSPQLFAFVFGEKWYQAGVIAQILVPWIFVNFIVSPVSSIVLILEKQKTAFLITIIDLMLKSAALVYGGIKHDAQLAFTLMSAVGFCSAVVAIGWYYSLAKKTV